MKMPVQLIVGPKDKENREVSVRTQKGEEKIALDNFSRILMKALLCRVLEHSLRENVMLTRQVLKYLQTKSLPIRH